MLALPPNERTVFWWHFIAFPSTMASFSPPRRGTYTPTRGVAVASPVYAARPEPSGTFELTLGSRRASHEKWPVRPRGDRRSVPQHPTGFPPPHALTRSLQQASARLSSRPRASTRAQAGRGVPARGYPINCLPIYLRATFHSAAAAFCEVEVDYSGS